MDLGRAVNSAAGWLCASPPVKAVASNPFYTALLLTALAAVVGLAAFKGGRPGGKEKARALLYFFLGASAVLVVHHYAVGREAAEDSAAEGVRRVFTNLDTVRAFGGGVAVVPGARPPPAAPAPPPAAPAPPRPAPLSGQSGGAERGSALGEALEGGGPGPLRVEDVQLGNSAHR